MPVTTVSGKVANLEKRLGVTLIHRTTRKLNITQAGEAYFKHCVRALEEVSAGERQLATEKSEPEGLIRITAPPDIGHTLLPSIIRSYLKRYPKVRVELDLTNRIVDLVSEGVDLAIRVGTLKDSSLVATKFMDADAALWASSAYIRKFGMPKHPKDLSQHSIIGMKAFPELTLTNGRQSYKLENVPRILVNDIEALKVFVVGGDGIALIPSFVCGDEASSGKLSNVLPGWNAQFGPTVQVWFVYPPHRFVPPKIQAFIELAKRG